MSKIFSAVPWLAGLFISGIFLDSLRFKFSGHPTPQHIFTTLREWSGIGLFYPAGPWVIGLAEFAAALLLILLPVILILGHNKIRAYKVQMLGALLALGVMTGAIVFHVFTPLGIETPIEWNGDEVVKSSPALFISACVSWLCAVLILIWRSRQIRKAKTI